MAPSQPLLGDLYRHLVPAGRGLPRAGSGRTVFMLRSLRRSSSSLASRFAAPGSVTAGLKATRRQGQVRLLLVYRPPARGLHAAAPPPTGAPAQAALGRPGELLQLLQADVCGREVRVGDARAACVPQRGCQLPARRPQGLGATLVSGLTLRHRVLHVHEPALLPGVRRGAGAGAGARCAAEERGHGPEEARAAGPGGYGLRAPALLGRRAGLAPARRCGLGRQLVALALQPALHVLHIAALLELKLLVTPLTAQLAQELPLVVAVAEARDGDPNHLPPCWRQSFESQELAGRFALPGREALVPVTHTVEAAIPVGQVDRLLQRVVRAGRQEEVWPAGGDAGPARPQNILRQVLLRPCAPHA
eukprot:CAMPEP_0175741658 /NCGR_PEP_ID=MMETSP0097-20121207/56134_1 /TAXON_ID=311494 /ORGANISM="Alexandrium monilatum, Strain CCMP3105" /LENGTH=361 /DNA_ID=CAMNT_0017049961 /DNA_START=323 /DNA_END=1403 /DNA_ORIENTATION=-